jgi:meso-butanediol dehydrogenase/(S,S)-butanediol dehydrogenase/diacetyl reductase
MHRFPNKTVMITGAASGIGRATAQRFAAEGAQVAISDMNATGLEESLASLEGSGHHAMALDVSDPAACRAAVAGVVAQFGRLDVLCNVAGIAFLKHLADVSDADWHRMIGVNLSGTFFLCQAAMPHLLESKGNIVNIASTAALGGQAYNAAYCASKGGVLMLTKALAVEFAARGVRVNAVCPGGVNTPLAAGIRMPEGADPHLVSKLFPLIDSADPAEIAGAVAYLASDEARFITGEGLVIDGGQTAS